MLEVAMIELTDAEWAELKKPIRGTGGFQDLMKALRQRAAIRRGKLELRAEDLEKIQRYAFYDTGGYEGRLLSIFSRTLGPKLTG